MSEHLLDNIFNDKLSEHRSAVPDGLFDKIITEVNLDNAVKDKLTNFSAAVSPELFNKITDNLTVDTFFKHQLENHISAVPARLWDKIANERIVDAHIKDSLENYESPVSEEVWEKIEEDEERKRPIVWWLFNERMRWVAAACLLALFAGAVYVSINKNNKVGIGTESISKSTDKQSKQNSSNINNSSDKSVVDENSSQSNDITVNQNRSTDNSSNDFINSSQNNQSSSSIIDNSVSSSSTNKNVVIKGINRGNKIHSNNSNKNSWETSLIRNSTNNQNDITTSTTTSNNNNSTDLNEELDKKRILPNDLMKLENLQSLYALRGLMNNKAAGVNIIGCPNGSYADWFIEVYASTDYTMKSVLSYGLSEAFLQRKDSSEKMLLGFTAGLRLTKRINDRLILKTGLQYAQINEQFALRTENERKTTTVIVSRTISRAQGDTTISDTTSVTEIGYRVQKNINHYRRIELPLSIGYEFGRDGDKWRLGLNGGAIINLSSWYEGQTIDTSNNVISISNKDAGVYKKSAGLALFASASVTRKINDNLDVFAEPYFRYDLSGMASSVGYTQKFHTVGISIGTRIKLNNRRQR